MGFTFSEEQEQLREEVRRFLGAKASSAENRRVMAEGQGIDRAVWSQMATQLGLQSLAIPEEYGGSGFTAVESGIVLEEMGRALLISPYFSSVGLAANVLLSSDDEDAKKDLLPGLADGSVIGTAALADEPGSFDPARLLMRADSTSGEWLLTGECAFVTDGLIADLLLLPAQTDRGLSLFAVNAQAPEVRREPMSALDLTRPLSSITCTAAPARLIGAEGAAGTALSAGRDRAMACLAAEQVGGAQRCLDMAVDYAKTRVQFDRPIGSFQAIKHKCADMLVTVEAARSAAYYAAWAASEEPDELPLAVSVASAYCADAFFSVAAENIQIHGGIGFTWEHDAHLFFRRAKSSQLLFGTPDSYRDRLADLVGF